MAYREASPETRWVLAMLFRRRIVSERTRVERNSWAEKLQRLVTAILQESEDHILELQEEYLECPNLQAMPGE